MTVPFAPSDNVARMRESATIAVSQLARALRARGRRIIDLGAGEPDFDTPEFIRRAAQRAIDEGATRYTAVEGIASLREAIAARAGEALPPGATPIDPREVVVTTGSKQALFNACFCLFGQDDEVLVPTPAWTSYYEMVGLARARAVPVEGDERNGFKVSVEQMRRAMSSRTRGLILNSPCNPTGSVYERAELEAVAALAAEHDLWIISDEIYRYITQDDPATSALSVAASRDRLVVVDGVAKAFAMTGWRIGWAIAPLAVARTFTALQSHTTSNASSVSQHAALAALVHRADAERAVAGMVAQYRKRRAAAVTALLDAPDIRFVRPEGAFYLFVDVRDTAPPGTDAGAAFASRLLEEHGVAVVPGAAFRAPGWIRISLAAAASEVEEGMSRVVQLRNALRGEVLTPR